MEERSFQEFTTEIQGKRGNKSRKVTRSFGVYDVYKKIRKNKWYDIGRPVTEKEFYAIIRGVNKLLAEEIANGNPITFPSRMGKIELKKVKKGVSIVDGKLKVTYPVNWAETMSLWFEDEEARKNKTLIRDEQEYVYRTKYDVFDATYENKSFYQFVLNRFIKIALKENIKNGKIDTLW
jgi:hypothetical protein